MLPLEVILLKARGCRVKLGGNLPGLTLPHNVGDLADLESDLRILNLACCSLRGKVPASFANLTALEALYLQHNQLTGEVPDALRDSGIELQTQHNRLVEARAIGPGGVTFAELAAVRWLGRHESPPRQYVVGTTHMCSGDSLIESLIHSFENNLKRLD